MRSVAVAGIAAVAAAIGGVTALVLGEAAGIGGGETTVVVPVETGSAAATPDSPASRPLLGNGFDPAAIYARRSPGVVTIYANLGADGASQGSGFVVDPKGRILTNAHVITNVAESPTEVRPARAVYVEFTDGERVPATIVGWDLFNDVGVIRVDPAAHAVQPVPLGRSATVVVGMPVAAIGSPFGKQSSLSVGVVSATGRSIDSLTSGFAVANAIQIDAPINRGNSGGPLFDARGRVIGINAQIQSTSGTAEGVGFAIPIDIARRSLDQLVRAGRVRYAYIGISTQDVTPSIAERFGLGAPRGALVARVEPGTPAARAGIRAGTRRETVNGIELTLGGDVVVAIGDEAVTSADDIGRIVTLDLLPGQTVPFTLLRGGSRRVVVDVTLADRPREPR